MKQPFRYFRGEFNRGRYLYALVICPNFTVQDLLDELVYQTLFQWKLEDELEKDEMPVRDDDIINIAKIAGLFQPRSTGRASIGSTYFTQSHVVNGQERSERGLMDMQTEGFKFVRTARDEYEDDIVNEASADLRMGLVPEDAEPVGFLPVDVPLYTETGDVIWENLLSEPPDDGSPYIAYYGERFLIHEEFFSKDMPLNIKVFKLLFECVQQIRHNGPTIMNFMEITRVLGAGYIYGIEIIPQGPYYTVYYSIDDLSEITDKARRLAAWRHICDQKFKLFLLELRT